MIKAKFRTRDGGIVERNAADILFEINQSASIPELIGMRWSKDEGKIDYLQGRIEPLIVNCPIEPLTDEDAKQAVQEYKELMGL